MTDRIEVEVEEPAWDAALADAAGLARIAAEAALEDADIPTGGVAVLLTGDEAVRELNARFREKDTATNVLSFPAAAMPGENGPENHLGDVALAYGVCAREAAEQGKTLAAHLQHLVAHGVLHLVGFDHETDDEAQTMEARERQILGRLGVADPYA